MLRIRLRTAAHPDEDAADEAGALAADTAASDGGREGAAFGFGRTAIEGAGPGASAHPLGDDDGTFGSVTGRLPAKFKGTSGAFNSEGGSPNGGGAGVVAEDGGSSALTAAAGAGGGEGPPLGISPSTSVGAGAAGTSSAEGFGSDETAGGSVSTSTVGIASPCRKRLLI